MKIPQNNGKPANQNQNRGAGTTEIIQSADELLKSNEVIIFILSKVASMNLHKII